jgi:hypothetical protein
MSGVQRMSTYHTFGLTARSLSTYLSGESKGVHDFSHKNREWRILLVLFSMLDLFYVEDSVSTLRVS